MSETDGAVTERMQSISRWFLKPVIGGRCPCHPGCTGDPYCYDPECGCHEEDKTDE